MASPRQRPTDASLEMKEIHMGNEVNHMAAPMQQPQHTHDTLLATAVMDPIIPDFLHDSDDSNQDLKHS